MFRPFESIGRFLRELKRRNVYKVGLAYLAVAFVSLQAVGILIPATTVPAWTDELLLALLIVGFPVSLVIAWAFEVTPEGVRRTPEALESVPAPSSTGGESRSAVKILVGLGAVALAVVGGWYLTGSDAPVEIEERSLAVLPFETLGAEEASAFTDGVHGDLLTRLSRISEFRVTSRTSVLRYRNSEAALPAIAEELNVSWVLRGEVQESGNRVRVNARLIHAREDRQVWAESYTRELSAENLFAIQEEITRRIVQELQARLTASERRRLGDRPTESLDAYRLYVRGRALLDQQTEPHLRQAAAWFGRAIERDSSYALAWSGRADALIYLAEYGYAPVDSVLPSARRAVQRAMALDAGSAEVHVSRAFLNAAAGDGPALIRELRRAVELRPSYAQPHSLLGWYYPVLGRAREGLESAERAVELDPLAPEAWVNVALGQLTTGRPASALAPARRTRELQSDYSAAPFYEAIALYELGRLDEAAEVLREIELGWAPSAPRVTRSLVRLAAGDSAAARELLASLPRDPEALAYRGLLHAALGERDAAFDAFLRIEGWERSPLLGWPNVSLRYLYSDVLGPLRGDPRYERLIGKIDRSWGLVEDGSLTSLPGRPGEVRPSLARP